MYTAREPGVLVAVLMLCRSAGKKHRTLAATGHIFHIIISCIIHAFITLAHSVVVPNQRRWQSMRGKHGKELMGYLKM